MFYVDVESAAVSVVKPTNARHHKMYVRVAIVGTRKLLKKETRDLLKKDVCLCVLHDYEFYVGWCLQAG